MTVTRNIVFLTFITTDKLFIMESFSYILFYSLKLYLIPSALSGATSCRSPTKYATFE